MAILRYRDYYISVLFTPDKSGNASYVPFVEIRHNRGSTPIVRLTPGQSFSRSSEAKVHGFEIGKKWIEETAAQRKLARSEAPVQHRTGNNIRFRLKTWFASLFL